MRFIVSRLLKKAEECFDELSMSGNFSVISILSPFVPSMNSGQALSLVEGLRKVFQQPVSFGVFLIIVGLCSPADARKWRVRPHDLATDYSQIIDQRGGGEVVVVYWIAPETIDPGMRQAETLKAMLKEHIVVAVAHGTAGQGGRLHFDTPEGVTIEDENKKQREPLAKENWPPLVSAYTAVMQKFLSQTTGQLGSGLHWFAFDGEGIESCGKGRFWITYAGERYNYDTPIPGCSQ